MPSKQFQAASVAFFLVFFVGARAAEFRWIRNAPVYEFEARRLQGHLIAKYENVYTVTQCARRCQLLDACKSYNFQSDMRVCQINSVSHVTNSGDVIADDHWQYYERNAFTIDKDALGPCANSPCKNGGTCLTTSSRGGVLSHLCLCTDNWTGSDCTHTAASLPTWEHWGDWGSCSAACGDGVKIRRRRCVDTTTGLELSSQLCYGRDQELESCKGLSCPAWTDYSEWGECSTDVRCGQGVKLRTRNCTNGGTPGVDRLCKGPSEQTTVCQSPSCDAPVRLVDGPTYGEGRVNIYNDLTGQWTPVCAEGWTKPDSDVVCRQLGFFAGADNDFKGDYGPEPGASVAMSRVRCQGNEASLATCPHGSWHEACASSTYAGVKCKVDGRWSPWNAWGQCSHTCGNGTVTRSRQCNWPAPQRGGKQCSGDSTESKPCYVKPCPVDSSWSEWSDWAPCSVTCGGGTQSRDRTCTPALHGGKECDGNDTQTQSCKDQPCPVDGRFGNWSAWGACSVTCGNGTHSRQRQCIGPEHGGRPCVGDTEETQACFDRPCPVDGTWGPWGHWSSCTKTCGTGQKVRSRTCDGPFHGGAPCQGDSTEEENCNVDPCPVDGSWSLWSTWLQCSVSCGQGTQRRYRVCGGTSNGGRACQGESEQFQPCNDGPCPVDCTWDNWSQWSSCNATCGGGVRTRTRTKVNAQHGGVDCQGESIEREVCSSNPCSIPGVWLPFSAWSRCSVTCGGGQRTRTRTCDMTSRGSLTVVDCLPENGIGATDTKPCHDFSCDPAAKSCAELLTRGLEENVNATIDTDGAGGPSQPFTAYCEIKGTTAYTVVYTAEEAETEVNGYEGPCEFNKAVGYLDTVGNAVDISQLIPLVDAATTCRQLVRWRCRNAIINSASNASNALTYWRNRNGDAMAYFGNATARSVGSPLTVMCGCGETDSCGAPGKRCHCDMNDDVWRIDEGYVTNRPDLPVKEFCAGDTGSTDEQGYYVVGPLICS